MKRGLTGCPFDSDGDVAAAALDQEQDLSSLLVEQLDLLHPKCANVEADYIEK